MQRLCAVGCARLVGSLQGSGGKLTMLSVSTAQNQHFQAGKLECTTRHPASEPTRAIMAVPTQQSHAHFWSSCERSAHAVLVQPYVAPKCRALAIHRGIAVWLPICAQQAMQLERCQRHEPVNVSLHQGHNTAVNFLAHEDGSAMPAAVQTAAATSASANKLFVA